MALDNADIRLLRLFMTIVEAGGFAAAQGELNLSLSTISTHVSTLETRLGVVLCRRGRAGFEVTPEGQAVYDEGRRLFGAVERFDARIRGLKQQMTGTLALGLVDNTITDPRLPLDRVFARFAAAAPEVALSIVTRQPSELLRDVIAGQLQVAISGFPRLAPGLSYLPLHVEVQKFYCGRGHPLFAVDDADIDIDAVRRHRVVARGYWGQRDLKVFDLGTAAATVSDMEAEARLILSGAYLGYLPDHYARRFEAEGLMRPIRPSLFGYQAQFQAAHDATRSDRAIVALFLDILGDEVRQAAG